VGKLRLRVCLSLLMASGNLDRRSDPVVQRLGQQGVEQAAAGVVAGGEARLQPVAQRYQLIDLGAVRRAVGGESACSSMPPIHIRLSGLFLDKRHYLRLSKLRRVHGHVSRAKRQISLVALYSVR